MTEGSCSVLLKALKKLRVYLYGVRFVVEIDARTFVHQLNQPASTLPGSVVNRWLAWIRMFSFEIKHVEGKKHGGPDGLSRRKKSEEDSDDDASEEHSKRLCNLCRKEHIERLRDVGVGVNELEDEEEDGEIPEDFRRVKRYLTTLQRPEVATRLPEGIFRQYALSFLVQGGLLFRRSKPDLPPKRPIWKEEEQKEILRQLHEESGHRGDS